MQAIHLQTTGRRCRRGVVAVIVLAASGVGRASILTGVPTYEWYYGCAPTSAGMMIGYWDGLGGYGDLFYGDASVETQAVRDMIASPEHLVDPYAVSHPANSIADFMRTSLSGITAYPDIGPGLADYVAWDDPTTPVDEGYEATVVTHDLSLLGGDLSWGLYTSEIDAGRPVMLNVAAYFDGEIYGHTVVGYGYQQDLFEVLGQDGETMITVGGIAVRDTWPAGTVGSQWVSGDPNHPIDPIIDGGGVEWWPWLEPGMASSDGELWDWVMYQGMTMDVVPEPAGVGVLALGGALVVSVRRRRR